MLRMPSFFRIAGRLSRVPVPRCDARVMLGLARWRRAWWHGWGGLATWAMLAAWSTVVTTASPTAEVPQAVTAAGLWEAHWIAHPTETARGHEVLRFRKTFTLESLPEQLIVHLSADRRYRCLVNGVSVAVGPQRSDPFRWHYETVDLTPHVRVGENVLAATVWNYGEDHPWALTTVRTALIVQTEGPLAARLNTGADWRVKREAAYTALPVDQAALQTFIVVGPGDRVDGRQLDWDWAGLEVDDAGWSPARVLGPGTPEAVGTDLTWWLAPRNIPLPFERPQRFAAIRGQEGAAVEVASFMRGTGAWTIPPHSSARLLLDQGFETNAYPRLRVSGGRDAMCRLTYAEALLDARQQKGHRDDVEGRRIIGVQDEFIADGGAQRVFSPLLFRTYRYVELRVRTAGEALTIHDLDGLATGYPFEERGAFASDQPRLARVWEVGVRTAQLCAYETYVDCPYYEQMQYVGDTRIQALISLYAFGDDRLMRNALEQYDRSRLPMGLTQSRYPTTRPQIIPPFSLFWVQMAHDYWWHRADDAFVRARLPGIRQVLAWFEEHVDPASGLLGPLPYWCFVDWPEAWPWLDQARPGGMPPGIREGGSAIMTLHFAWTLQQAAELAAAFGHTSEAARWRERSAGLVAAVQRHCWHAERGVFADTPQKTSRSQHVNALAVLAGATDGPAATELMRRVRADPELTPCTLYFGFYLLRAAKQAGLGDDYVASLQPWFDMIDRGLTTFAERPDPTRSDCHAWSASPVYELLATVCGIEPAKPGFRRVRIEPWLGELRHAAGRLPHPAGLIEVRVERDATGDHGRAEITLPAGVSGAFVWRGTTQELRPGRQTMTF